MTADIRPGAIVYLYIPTIFPPAPKYGVIGHIDTAKDSVSLFLIHSELPKFIQDSPTKLKGITKIDKANHPFLDYDSWLRFGDVHGRQYSEIVQKVGAGERCFHGYASVEVIVRLIELIPKSPELSQRWKDRYCAALAATLTGA